MIVCILFMSFTGLSCMSICLRMSPSQIHKKIKLDKKMKVNMQLYFESLLQHIFMITRPGKDYKVIEINSVIQQ